MFLLNDPDGGFKLAVSGVKMRRSVVACVNPDHDPQESADFGHSNQRGARLLMKRHQSSAAASFGSRIGRIGEALVLMVLQSAADLHLMDESGKPIKLKVPLAKAKPADMLAAAKEFDETPGGHPNSPICGHLKLPHP